MDNSWILFTFADRVGTQKPDQAALMALAPDQHLKTLVPANHPEMIPLFVYPVPKMSGILILGLDKTDEFNREHLWFTTLDGSIVHKLGASNIIDHALLIDQQYGTVYITNSDKSQGLRIDLFQISTGSHSWLGTYVCNKLFLLDLLPGQNTIAFSLGDIDMFGHPTGQVLIQHNQKEPWSLYGTRAGRTPCSGASSPNGDLFATTRARTDDLTHEVVVYQTDSWRIVNPTVVTDLDVTHIAWSPSGDYLAATACRQATNWYILFYNKKTGYVSTIFLDSYPRGQITAPRWTPDGQAVYLGLADQCGDNNKLFRVSRNSDAVEVPLPSISSISRYFAFDKSGQHIFLWDYRFDSTICDNFILFCKSVASSNWKNLTDTLPSWGHAMYPQWARNPYRFSDLSSLNCDLIEQNLRLGEVLQ